MWKFYECFKYIIQRKCLLTRCQNQSHVFISLFDIMFILSKHMLHYNNINIIKMNIRRYCYTLITLQFKSEYFKRWHNRFDFITEIRYFWKNITFFLNKTVVKHWTLMESSRWTIILIILSGTLSLFFYLNIHKDSKMRSFLCAWT